MTFRLEKSGRVLFDKAAMKNFAHHTIVKSLWFANFLRVFYFILGQFLFSVTRVLIWLLFLILLVRVRVSQYFKSLGKLFRVFRPFTFSTIRPWKLSFSLETFETDYFSVSWFGLTLKLSILKTGTFRFLILRLRRLILITVWERIIQLYDVLFSESENSLIVVVIIDWQQTMNRVELFGLITTETKRILLKFWSLFVFICTILAHSCWSLWAILAFLYQHIGS